MKRRSFLKMLATTCCAVAAGIEFVLPEILQPQAEVESGWGYKGYSFDVDPFPFRYEIVDRVCRPVL